MKDFSIIAAMDKNRGIGRDGLLPWHLPSDMKFFKKTTTETRDSTKINAVLMGRKTWESLPERFRPLNGRLNVIVSRKNEILVPEGCLKCADLIEAFNALGDRHDIETVFVIGGGSIYEQALPMKNCRSLYLTQIDQVFQCDTFFPEIPFDFHQCSRSENFLENGCSFAFVRYTTKA